MIWISLEKRNEKGKTYLIVSLVNYIPETKWKAVSGSKNKVVSPFKTNTSDGYGRQTTGSRTNQWKKNSNSNNKKKSEHNIIKNLGDLFRLEKANEAT